ncbi:TonB-dependent receptor [Marinimicrobium alkaliphilum]|uniref:TonB-dependent receptor n=1 Tax=Marinimicrobium alkaliphilum TaxID=2202654 RepID=UPI001E401F99|nr:TonB-dependent receptor [Marinimicrobium alkaliphilum]
MKKPTLRLLALLVAAPATVSGTATYAQGPMLEEVLITAQKREQRMTDVPVSVNALQGEKLEESGITSVERMADYIPSLNMTQTGLGTTISIRGISSGVNQGFEQSAAQFVDGIHHGRSQLARAPMFDLERVEVLRGPQSILFGKNSTAGAISMITAKPTDTFQGRVSALYEPEHGEQDIRLVVSGPFSDTLSGRLAIMDRQMDGYYHNTTLGRDEAQEESRVIRGSLRWRPSPEWDINLKVEDSTFDSTGRNLEVINPVELPVEGAVSYANLLAGLTGQVSGGEFVYQLDTDQNFNRQSNGDYSYNDSQSFALSIERGIGDHDFTSVTGYASYSYEEMCDCDFTGLPMFFIASNEDYTQFSQEFRIASSPAQQVSYLAGVFFQTSEMEFDDVVGLPQDSWLATALSVPPEEGGIGPDLANLLRSASSNKDFTQDSDTAAIFAQVTWNINDFSRLIVGGRYTHEEKDGTRRQTHINAEGQALPPSIEGDPTDPPHNIPFGLFEIEPYDTIRASRSESSFTPSLTYQFDLNETDMVYASYTTGFKSGGFDVRSNAHPDPTVDNAVNVQRQQQGQDPTITGVFEFEDEQVKNYEIGGKFLLRGGAAELNVALFRTEFSDLQTSVFDGAFSFNVTNAGEAEIHGLELDGRWALSNTLTLNGGLAWLDFEYTDFPTAQCYFGQTSDTAPLCDASGSTREFTPELQGNLGLNHRYSLGNGLLLNSTFDVIFSDSYLTSPTLDPRTEQDAYMKLNARVALSGNQDQWEVALVGKNLTDESIISHSNGMPISTVLTQGTGTAYYAFYERPRSIALQGTYRF